MTATICTDYDTLTISISHEPDWNADISYLEIDNDPEYAELNAERLDAYRNGDWSMIGVVVQAFASNDNMLSWEHVRIASASLWCIESDSEPSYLRDVANELITFEIMPALESAGFPADMIASAIALA